jgi:hypothetical protein
MRLLLPWAAIPLFAVLACATPNFGGAWLRPSYLCIPLVALLAFRYGRRGLLTSVLGMFLALYVVNLGWPWVDYSPRYENYFFRNYVAKRPLWPLLPISLRLGLGSVAADWAVYAVALAAGWAAMQRHATIAAFDRIRIHFGVVLAAIALLPFSMLLYREEMGGGFVVYSLWRPLPLLYLLMLVLGLSPQMRAPQVIGALAAASIAGPWFEWSRSPVLAAASNGPASAASTSARFATIWPRRRASSHWPPALLSGARYVPRRGQAGRRERACPLHCWPHCCCCGAVVWSMS